jgi:uncharacterized protein YdiU (UPF0061 family)
MPDVLETAWLNRFAAKIGIATPQKDDLELVQSLLTLMQEGGADFTNTFWSLGKPSARDQFTNRDAFDMWAEVWTARLKDEPAAAATMAAANPALIPRNHRIEAMIEAAVAGDMTPFERLHKALATPFANTDLNLQRPPSEDEIVPATFCGT